MDQRHGARRAERAPERGPEKRAACGGRARAIQRGQHAVLAVFIGYTNADGIVGDVEVEAVLPRDLLEWRDMHHLFGSDRVAGPDRAEVVMRAEVTVPVTEGVVDLGHYGAGFAVDECDPETYWIEMEPEETRLGQKRDLCPFQWKSTFFQDVPEPGLPDACAPRAAMARTVK